MMWHGIEDTGRLSCSQTCQPSVEEGHTSPDHAVKGQGQVDGMYSMHL